MRQARDGLIKARTLLHPPRLEAYKAVAFQHSNFVSRFFASVIGIDEDPVTGSAHSQLIPFWADKLGKNTLHAMQLSKRGGELWCTYSGDRVTMAGQCVYYMKGEITI